MLARAPGGLLAMLLLGSLAGGCATLPRVPVARTRVPDTVDRSPVVDEPSFLRLRPGDRLTLQVSSVRESRFEDLPVDARGAVHVPGLGEVMVGGMGIDAAERVVAARLRQVDRLGSLDLSLASPAGQSMAVLGAVPNQGVLPVVAGMRLADAYAVVTAEEADESAPDRGQREAPAGGRDLARAVLRREGRVLKVDLRRALAADPAHNILVRPGDLLFVPRARARVVVMGQIGAAGVLPYREGLRLTEAVAQAGGVRVGGDRRDLRLIRGEAAAPAVYSIDLLAITAGEQPDVGLQPGDVLYVTDHWFENHAEAIAIVATVVGTAALVAAVSLTRSGP